MDPAYLARTATLYFNLSGATYKEIFDNWLDFEPVIAAKVARMPDRRRKRAALAPFVDEHDPGDDFEHFEELNNFHSVLGSLAGNRVADPDGAGRHAHRGRPGSWRRSTRWRSRIRPRAPRDRQARSSRVEAARRTT